MVEGIDAIPESDAHQPEAHSPPGNNVLDVQCNSSAISDLEENTAHTTQESEQESTLVAKSGVELAERKPRGNPVEPGVSTKGTAPATSRPKRVIRPPHRHGGLGTKRHVFFWLAYGSQEQS